ncbi:MAG TPA: beta-ketoacyl synthase N-terminal-like domain-containing protein [Polyangiaceae bacterium]|nr:beta-ketoacyl synthase N-terminal-like domain-containing protein [Polyangiaceae bacterium]
MRRIGIFGWGIVAPKSRDIAAFERNLFAAESWLSPFDGFGPSHFLVGSPEFRFSDYKAWIDARFPGNRYAQIERKMGLPVQYAVGAFIQALGQNPGIEGVLQELGTAAHVYVGCALGDLQTIADNGVALHRAQRRWDRFWADTARNDALRAWLACPEAERDRDAPPHPESAAVEDRDLAEDVFWRYWAARSTDLHEYLQELRLIESAGVSGNVETAKIAVIKEKRARITALQKKWKAPEPPWNEVSANVLWNIQNAPASQISMVGRIVGATFAPLAACSTFGYALKFAMNSITLGQAKAVVVGATDPAPHRLSVGGFYQARVLSADGEVSKPLTNLRGTHVAGGSVIWIVGDYEYMTARGFTPLGMEPIAVGLSADADHIITPSKEGPARALGLALDEAGVAPAQIGSWDLHATATPGDFLEVETMRSLLPETVLVTARKGTFGHGMGACGGWELTAQYLAQARGQIPASGLTREQLNAEIAKVHQRFVFDEPCAPPEGLAGKMSMGIGGINACVISRPWTAPTSPGHRSG